MSDPVRLSRRVAELAQCSRTEAEQYIQGGWVKVDGRVVEEPQRMVTGEAVELDPQARAQANEPATLLLHKPPGFDAIAGPRPAAALVGPDSRWSEDPSGVRLLQQHFQRLVPLVPLERDASGLIVLSQDGRVRRRLVEDADSIEHEYIVEVAGEIALWGLGRLNRGMAFDGRPATPCKVSWQNETRLRFAIKACRDGQLQWMCAQVGLQVVSIRRIRIGRIPLAKMPAGQWRYLPAGERF